MFVLGYLQGVHKMNSQRGGPDYRLLNLSVRPIKEFETNLIFVIIGGFLSLIPILNEACVEITGPAVA
jgi:hypothetical protein